MSRKLFLLSVFILLTAQTCAPTGAPQESTAGTTAAISYGSLVEHLRKAGLTVETLGEVEQPFFTPAARVIRIGTTGEAQVYEYATEEAAAADAGKVNADGSIGGSMPMWIAPPHFFRRKHLMVLYLGRDDAALASLRGFLGTEFARKR